MSSDVPPFGELVIRRYEQADAGATRRVFHAAVHGTASRDYTPEQVQAWAPADFDEVRWRGRRAASYTYVACLDGVVVGFSDFTDDGLLDMLFVHPDAGGRGVARALVDRVLREATAAGHRRLRVHASLTARPAFERFGFVVDAARVVEVRGQRLRNFDMSIALTTPGRPRAGRLRHDGPMVDWATLRHAYGSAEDTPGHLTALRSADEEERRVAFGELYASITHQGNRYSASAAAVPALLELVADPAVPDRDLLLYLLGLIAVGADAAWLPGGVRRDELGPDEAGAYHAVASGLPLLDTLTAEPELADSAAYLLGWYPGRPESVPVLARLNTPTALVALGLLGLAEGVPIAERALTDERPLMRWAAAVALAHLHDDGGRAELLRWATGDHPTEPTIGYLNGDVAGLALLSLESIVEDVLEPALVRLAHVSAEPALTTIGVLLRQAFPGGPIAAGTAFPELTERRRRVVRALVDTPGAWLYDGVDFTNVRLLISDYGLPHGRDRLRAYLTTGSGPVIVPGERLS
ncbi:hypothetical protein Q0Z83_028330 [Actinoplanes sichuanensis]|uniref:GNAT family N-acetyltransferase n=1 Tax=Actinoplanes sichuanensis TaxID=512349 RepID=A0ABW4ATK1_9ACTN|nr:GNAT family N-acetyltransferase [Actinoplanes sichuanensis]BEL04642.1 hypothetical protein Q0Z83_028330 [Actinoplanes sichuanensis]